MKLQTSNYVWRLRITSICEMSAWSERNGHITLIFFVIADTSIHLLNNVGWCQLLNLKYVASNDDCYQIHLSRKPDNTLHPIRIVIKRSRRTTNGPAETNIEMPPSLLYPNTTFDVTSAYKSAFENERAIKCFCGYFRVNWRATIWFNCIKPLRFSTAIWRHKFKSTLAQVTDWCLTVPSH